MVNRNSKEFKKLKAKWYKKLTNSGFVDQEHDERNLKQFSGKASIDQENGRSKLDRWTQMGVTVQIKDHWKWSYYSRAREFLNSHQFSSKTEKLIFSMHTEGIGVRDIAAKIGRFKKSKIHLILQRLVKEMKSE